MSAFMHATCPKCSKRFGWTGELVDKPPCPRCGRRDSRQELEDVQRAMDAAERRMLADALQLPRVPAQLLSTAPRDSPMQEGPRTLVCPCGSPLELAKLADGSWVIGHFTCDRSTFACSQSAAAVLEGLLRADK